MSLHTVNNLRDSVAGLLSGIDINNVENLNGALERASRTLIQNADIPEASGIQNITLYSGVYDYLCDSRIFGTAINDIRPQGISRYPNNFPIKTDQETFDRNKMVYYPSGTYSTFEFHNGVPIIRIVAPYTTQQVIISTMNNLDNWTTVGDATNLAVDSTFFYQAPASLRFNLSASGSSGGIQQTLQSPIDMTSYQGVGVVFLAVEMPTASDIASYTLRIGSDSSNYYTVTTTSAFLGNFTSGEFQLAPFDLANATTVGSPDITNIQYVQCTANYNGTAQTNMRFGYLFASLPTPAQILYQSSAIFLPVGSTTPLSTITANTDTIILTDAAYTLYEYESAISICQQTGGTTGSAMIQTFKQILNGDGRETGLYQKYRGDNPSQELRTLDSWYDNQSSYNGGYSGSW